MSRMAVGKADQTMCRVSCQGDPARGWYLLRQAVHLGEELSLFMRPRGPHLHSFGEVISSDMDRVSVITAWGIFSLNLLVTVHGARERTY